MNLSRFKQDSKKLFYCYRYPEKDEAKKSKRRKTVEHLKATDAEVEAIARDFAELVFYREQDLTIEERSYLVQFPKAEQIFNRILKQLKSGVADKDMEEFKPNPTKRVI